VLHAASGLYKLRIRRLNSMPEPKPLPAVILAHIARELNVPVPRLLATPEGARYILAEQISETAEFRSYLRRLMLAKGWW
jgi:hypothetical protein